MTKLFIQYYTEENENDNNVVMLNVATYNHDQVVRFLFMAHA